MSAVRFCPVLLNRSVSRVGYNATLSRWRSRVRVPYGPHIAKVAQLVEHDLAKVRVAGSNPVFRSISEYSSIGCRYFMQINFVNTKEYLIFIEVL